MKTCTKCLVEKDPTDFHWKNKSKQLKKAMCKSCCSQSQKEHWQRSEEGKRKRRLSNRLGSTTRRQRNREFIWSHLQNNPCPCGESDPKVLEFDHRDRTTKTKEICTMVAGCWSIEKIEQEITKCDVLCANCHRRKTYEQLGWWTGD